MIDQSWRHVFVGREAELNILKEAWGKARKNEPQLVTFLAESGVGKTRLVQQFYTWLSNQEDRAGYWPDTLESLESSLAVNPNFTEKENTVDIPWLWWGLRASDPAGRNQQNSIGSALYEGLPKLAPHVEPIILRRCKKEINKGVVKSMLSTVANIASLGIFNAVFEVQGLVELYKEEQSRQNREKLSVSGLVKEKEGDSSQLVFDYIKTILDKSDNDALTIPVVIVLDDAQWTDPNTLGFVERLWKMAKNEEWPLLVIATHWLREWNDYSSDNEVVKSSQEPHNLVELIHRNPKLFKGWEPHELRPVESDGLRPVLVQAFPQLTDGQLHAILERVGGNPQFLEDIILWMKNDTRKFFVDFDSSQPLTEKGEKLVLSVGKGAKAHLALIRNRFEFLDQELRELLALSSYQGVSFIKPLIIEVMKETHSRSDNDWLGSLNEAVYPCAVIDELSNVTNEFRQRNIYEVAKEHLTELIHEETGYIDRDSFKKNMLNALKRCYRSGEISKYSFSEQTSLLVLLINELESAESETDTLVDALVSLMELYYLNGRQIDASEVALKLFNLMPEHGWSLEEMSYDKQNEISTLLDAGGFIEEKINCFGHLINRMEEQNKRDDLSKKNLAMIYMNRAASLTKYSDYSEQAERDHTSARDIFYTLLDSMGETFPDEWENDLARLHLNTGNFMYTQGSKDMALVYAKAAVGMREGLRSKLGEQFPHEWAIDLAKAYGSRLVIDMDDTVFEITLREIIEMYQSAMKELVLGGVPVRRYQAELARTHAEFGDWLCKQFRLADAKQEYSETIYILQQLEEETYGQLPPEQFSLLAEAQAKIGDTK